jgi:CheY-like chemotaxis protein
LRILLVEDHAATRNALQHLLRNRAHQVAAAATAGEALRHARSMSFDLVISDVGLPDRSGYELMVDLRALQPRIIGIALSGYGMEEDFARSREAGFCTHLIKPITIGMLEEAVAALNRPAADAAPAEPPSA